jgi:hypothetical protein
MPGLVPGIHAFIGIQVEDMDGRDKPWDKPGHDDDESRRHGLIRCVNRSVPPPQRKTHRRNTESEISLGCVSLRQHRGGRDSTYRSNAFVAASVANPHQLTTQLTSH